MSYDHDSLPLPVHTLPLRVAEVNRVAAVANELSELLIGYFEQYRGDKVVKVDGGLLAKVAPGVVDIIAQLEAKYGRGGWSRMITRHHSDYSLAWEVHAATSDGNGTSFGHSSDGHTVYVGRLEGQELAELQFPLKERTDWTVEEILKKRLILAEVKQAMKEAKEALGPFERA